MPKPPKTHVNPAMQYWGSCYYRREPGQRDDGPAWIGRRGGRRSGPYEMTWVSDGRPVCQVRRSFGGTFVVEREN